MDEQFDKKLTGRIKDVFENYEHPSSADAGWAELRKKFPQKQERSIAWLWWSSAAAILLVVLGIGLWRSAKPDADNTAAVTPAQTKKTPPPTGNPIDSVPNAATIAKADAPQVPVAHNSNVVGESTLRPLKPSSQTLTVRLAYNNAQKQPNSSVLSTIPYTPPASVTATKIAIRTPDTTRTAPVFNSTQQIASVSQQPVDNQQQPESKPVVIAQQPVTPKTLNDLFKEDKPVNKAATDKKDSKRVNFAVYAATYFNYAEGSTNQVNAGAGITSDIRLGKRVKLSTGVLLAQNSLRYDNTPPVTADSRAFAAAPPAPNVQKEGLFASASAVPQFQNFNASLVGLDIPMNIKFEFDPDKSDTYISAGLSSGTFIDERYTARYTYRTNGIAGSGITTQDQTTSQSFGSFYFAKTLNFAFGIGTPVGKNRLVIEPFLKYPIGGMGSQDIRFGSGGVNLKFNFTSTKK